jgi:hexokinase
MDVCGNIPKLAHMKLDPKLPMAINCEWGAFDNQYKVLPRTEYDVQIDKASPRPGQQTFEKMVAGLYMGEIFRIILLDMHKNPDVKLFEGQDLSKIEKEYGLDSSFLSSIEESVHPEPSN